MILPALDDPDFIARDPQAITAEIIADYERLSGKTLYPAQVDRLLVDVIAYRETLVRIGVQEAAKQCLVRFAKPPMLNYLGELSGVTQLPAQPAQVTLRFSLDVPLETPLLIPVGTRAESGDGAVTFETEFDAILPAGQLFCDVPATSDTPGSAGNGWGLGQINSLVDTVSDADVSVTNTTIPTGGADTEDIERFRGRIMAAPEKFTTAGSEDAYRERVKDVHQSIVDVAVLSPQEGRVVLVPLLDTGLPGADMLVLIEAGTSGKRVRPLTDKVSVALPEVVDYTIEAALILYKTADAESVLSAAQDAARKWADDRAAGLGRDIVPVQFEAAIKVPGVYDIVRSSPDKIVIEEHQWARCTSITITIAGVADG